MCYKVVWSHSILLCGEHSWENQPCSICDQILLNQMFSMNHWSSSSIFYGTFMEHLCPFWSMTTPHLILFHYIEKSDQDFQYSGYLYIFDPQKKESQMGLKWWESVKMMTHFWVSYLFKYRVLQSSVNTLTRQMLNPKCTHTQSLCINWNWCLEIKTSEWWCFSESQQ